MPFKRTGLRLRLSAPAIAAPRGCNRAVSVLPRYRLHAASPGRIRYLQRRRAWSPRLPGRGDERGEGIAWRSRRPPATTSGRGCLSTKPSTRIEYGAYSRCCAFLAKCFEMLGQSTADRKVRHMYGATAHVDAFWTNSLSPARMREGLLSKYEAICRNLPYHSGLFNLISNLQGTAHCYDLPYWLLLLTAFMPALKQSIGLCGLLPL